ncbi:MAG: TVP38/TMEM64 family protein [Granulosicoccus sp.]
MKYGWRLLSVVIILGLLGWIWTQLPVAAWIEQVRLWILSLGWLGVAAFAALYVVVTVVLGPASGLTLMAGLAYGFWGFPLVVISATLAAAVAFLLGRYVAHERVNRWIENKPKLLALNRAVSDEGWRVVGLMRLSPIIPYGLQNYLFSVTHIGFVPFFLATLIGIMPATALYVYIGSLGQAIGHASTLQWVLGFFGLVATALVAWFVGKRATAALERQTVIENCEENYK